MNKFSFKIKFKLVNIYYKRSKISFKIIFTITIECVQFCGSAPPIRY